MTDLLGAGGSSSGGGSFPQTQTATGASAQVASAISSMTPAQFFADYHVTNSVDQALFITQGKLNQNAADYAWYRSLDTTDRQAVQSGIATAGLLKSSDATGIVNGTTDGAVLDAIGQASANGQGLSNWLQNVNQNGIAPIEQQISSNLTAAKNAENAAQVPIVANLTDTASAQQTFSKAFQDALGYQPSPQEMNDFVASLHGAQEDQAAAPKEAARAAAQEDAARAQSEESALNKLGPDGLDSFLSAYSSAVQGTGVAGGGTNQGPVTGSVATAADANQFITPGSKLPPETVAGFNPNGAEMVANTRPTMASQQQPNSLGFLGRLSPVGTHTVTTGSPTPGMATAPSLPPGESGATSYYGGVYALAPGLWKQAVAAIGKDNAIWGGKLPPSAAGQASQIQQHAAVGALAQQLYGKDSSWSDVAIQLAGGNPQKPTGTVLGTKTNLQSFAEGIANQVNDQIEAIQNQVSTQSAPIIGKEAPNPAADALSAAEKSDPDQYVAHNMSLVEGTLQKMLYGTPQIESQSTSNLAGDVAQVSASNSAAT